MALAQRICASWPASSLGSAWTCSSRSPARNTRSPYRLVSPDDTDNCAGQVKILPDDCTAPCTGHYQVLVSRGFLAQSHENASWCRCSYLCSLAASCGDPSQPSGQAFLHSTSLRRRRQVSYYEIYQERIRDLLSASDDRRSGLRVREHPTLGPHVVGLTAVEVDGWSLMRVRAADVPGRGSPGGWRNEGIGGDATGL